MKISHGTHFAQPRYAREQRAVGGDQQIRQLEFDIPA